MALAPTFSTSIWVLDHDNKLYELCYFFQQYLSRSSAELMVFCSASLTSGSWLVNISASQLTNFPRLRPDLLCSTQLLRVTWMPCCQTGSNGLLGIAEAALTMPLLPSSRMLWIRLAWGELHMNYNLFLLTIKLQKHFSFRYFYPARLFLWS